MTYEGISALFDERRSSYDTVVGEKQNLQICKVSYRKPFVNGLRPSNGNRTDKIVLQNERCQFFS